METYSPNMEAWVVEQLQQARPKHFAQLYAYYQSRGGPGLALAEAELAARKARPTAPKQVPQFIPTT